MSSQLVCTRKEFAGWVHDVLNRLYDSAYLGTHPLAGPLGDEDSGALYRSQRLRQVLLEAIRKHPVERFIHISTSEVYGTARAIPMTEDHPLEPNSPYAGTKVGGDRMAYSFY